MMLRRSTVVPSLTAEPAEASADGSLRQTAIRSGAYLTGRETVGAGIRLIGLMLVVRKIGPGDFGIYSAAAAYVAVPTTLAQMAAEIFLIRQPGPLPRRRYDEVFTTLLVASAVVVTVGMGISFAIAPFLQPHGVIVPMRILLLGIPVNILWAPMQACIERQFAYRRMGLLELGGDLLLYGTAAPLAFLGLGAWSLVAGFFAWQTGLLVGSMALSGLWPRLAWSRQTSKALFAHGRAFALTTWVYGARTAVITLIVGSYAGAVGVGLVNFAQRLVRTMSLADRGVHRIGIVAISKANKQQPQRLASALEEGTLLLMVVSALPFVTFGLIARWVIPGLFGHAWIPAIPLYTLLALWSMLRVPVLAQRTLLYAYGRNLPPAITALIELVMVSGISAVAVRSFGIVGFGIASVVAVSSTLYTHFSARRLVDIRYRRLLLPMAVLIPPMFVALVPMPWAVLLLLPPLILFSLPSMRRELRHVISTMLSTIRRRPAEPTPAAARAAVPPARLPAQRSTLQPATVHRPTVVSVPVAIAPARFGVGGPEMAVNGSFPNPASLFPPFQSWRLQAGAVADPTNPRIADRAEALDAYGLRFSPVTPPPLSGVDAARGDGVNGHGRSTGGRDIVQALMAETDPVTGLSSIAVLLARLGRMLGTVRDPGWTLAVVAVALRREGGRPGGAPGEEALARVACGLRSQLRFDDLVARVDHGTFVVAVTCVGRGADGAPVGAHLESAARGALGAAGERPLGEGWSVRSAQEVVPLPSDRDADELVRRVLGALDG